MRLLWVTLRVCGIVATLVLLTIGGLLTLRYYALQFDFIGGGRCLGPYAHRDMVAQVAFSPDGKTLASASNDKTVRLWDVASGRLKETVPASDCAISALAFSPDGTLLASSGGAPSGFGRLWDARTLAPKEILHESHCILSFAFSPDGRILAGGEIHGDLGIWDSFTGKRTEYLQAGRGGAINSVVFSSDGTTLMTAGHGGVKMWSVGPLVLKSAVDAPRDNILYCATLSRDGRLLATGSEVLAYPGPGPGEISLWDMPSGKEIAVKEGFRQPITTLAFSPDSDLLASGSAIGEVQLWNVAEILKDGKTSEGMQSVVPARKSLPVFCV